MLSEYQLLSGKGAYFVSLYLIQFNEIKYNKLFFLLNSLLRCQAIRCRERERKITHYLVLENSLSREIVRLLLPPKKANVYFAIYI